MPKATWGDVEGSPWEDELDDYPIYDGDLPPKGVYRLALKFLRLKKNKNDDPMLNGLLVINEPAGSKKAQYNGYDFWFNLNVTSQGSRWVNNFLAAIVPENKVAALRKAFWAQKVMIDKAEPPNVLSIGPVKITENMLVAAQCAHRKEYNSDDSTLDAKRFIRPTDFTFNSEGAPSGEGDSEEDWEDESEEEPEEGDEGEEMSEEEAEREAELSDMERPALLRVAKGHDISVKRGTAEETIIGWILDAEFGEEEEEEDEEPEEEEDEEVAEEEEPEPEPEPEPAPKRTRRTAAKPAPAKEEAAPAARAKTGTRRRRVTGDKPPF
jgi:hypothetical protein